MYITSLKLSLIFIFPSATGPTSFVSISTNTQLYVELVHSSPLIYAFALVFFWIDMKDTDCSFYSFLVSLYFIFQGDLYNLNT